MKIKRHRGDYMTIAAMSPAPHRRPKKPNMLFRTVLKIASLPDLWATKFHCRYIDMDKLEKKQPCLVLMNHSSFIDLEIASSVLYPRPLSIVCTSDGFVGKDWLMHQLGCIPTKKFVTDPTLIRDMEYALGLGSSILMYPEASYSFDGTATPLPDSLGYCVKKLGVPVVMIRTYGAFARDPLYNGLQKRKVPVSADVSVLFTPEEIAALRPTAIQQKLNEAFTFDNFLWQKENGIVINEPFRADYLNRVLYKCPHCLSEGCMIGKGTILSCSICGKPYTLTELGTMEAADGNTEFPHIPDWYSWERECVKDELLANTYHLEIPVDICILRDTKRLYSVGSGTLRHDTEGFTLDGCEGQLHYTQKPLASYSLYADYFWYEIGDVICIGDTNTLYYCFPTTGGDVVAKTRLAAEELFQLKRPRRIKRTDDPSRLEENV